MKSSSGANASLQNVCVQIAARAQGVPPGAKLRSWALAALGSRAEITVRVVDGREARALNRRYRSKDYATNVLSFAYETGRKTCGDVVLCASVVSREAREIIARLVEVHAAREGLVGISGNTRADLGEAFGMGGVAMDEQEEECDGTKEVHARIR